MQHALWNLTPEAGGKVPHETLQMRPVDPIAYKMNDVWGFDQDELPIEPFDIEIRITADTVLEGLEIFTHAVQEYMERHFEGFAREQFLERLIWTDDYEEVKTCEIIMGA